MIAALGDYKKWLQDDLLKRSNGEFAFGEDTYRKKLAADEMIDVPLDELLAIAETDLKKNQAAFAETAKRDRSEAHADGRCWRRSRPITRRPAKLLSTTQAELDAIGRFMTDHHIVTVPKAAPARVQETPPFLRATTTASMDIPGPFETVADRGVLQHDAAGSEVVAPKDSDEFMTQWYYARDLQRVGARGLAGPLPAVPLRASTFRRTCARCSAPRRNSEGWAHYCEQMVIDEGFHADDPRYRLAQIQDALLRDARFIVGIRMHTQGHDDGARRRSSSSRRATSRGRSARSESQARHVGSRPTATTRWAS